MDFKKLYYSFTFLVITSLAVLFFIGCSDKTKNNTDNTYYIELVNFTNDSLKQNVSENIFGKVSYYKNKELFILSLNYVTADFPNMHYFENAEALKKNITPGTKKIRIEFAGEYTVDSIRYALQKYTYTDKQWVKTSDMGFIKATTTYKKAKQFAIREFGRQIVNNTVTYTYN